MFITGDEAARNPPKTEVARIDFVDISIVPPWVYGQTQLRHLSLAGKRLTEIPAAVADMVWLEGLSIRGGTTRLPPGIGKLRGLTDLNLGHSLIDRLPDELDALVKLQHLDCNAMPLQRFPEVVLAFADLRYLMLCDAYDSKPKRPPMKTLPREVGRLQKLERVWLGYCGLTSLPDEIGEWRELDLFDAPNNELQRMPATMSSWTKLHDLNLKANALRGLPAIDACRALRRVHLTGNVFTPAAARALDEFCSNQPMWEYDRPRVDLPPVAPPAEASRAPLGAAVVGQLVRLGYPVAPPSDAPATRIEVRGQSWPVPEALRQLIDSSAPQRSHSATGTTGRFSELQFLGLAAKGLDEYECQHHRPYLVFGHADQSILVLALDDADPSDPTLYHLDHDDFGAIAAEPLGRLGEILRDFAPATPSAAGSATTAG